MYIVDLAVARYRFNLQAETPIHLPTYAGSSWRGIFGHALRRSVCVTRAPTCNGCLLQGACVYSAVFETPARREPLLAQISDAPHPYILEPLSTSGRTFDSGEHLQVGMVLIGKANTQLPYLVHALQQAGEQGLGRERGHYHLLEIEQEQVIGNDNWVRIYADGHGLQPLPVRELVAPALPEQPIQVCFQTPYRGLQQGKLMRDAEGFQFQTFMNGLIRRISLLRAYHGAGELTLDFRVLSELAGQTPMLESQLHWYDWSRYSNRQQRLVQMGGLLGNFQLPVDHIEPLWPYLWSGQWVHAGKGTVMGLGGYHLSTAH
ncbi:CRISPR system precrRNA processing endoribonuclease RAMP protein Cas6 [Thiofilum flexile]|uniref:CRISPR system precrRNA processing endoribonuclease RAMP protein Cas6 n=1 Tax=Thiofilum flexile TaxID=125627 RepID=UPI00036D44DC|nr:CRISPR system precrRNA processing endoribonuclease RAMP protein Cas6 [Thiofilum flexile]